MNVCLLQLVLLSEELIIYHIYIYIIYIYIYPHVLSNLPNRAGSRDMREDLTAFRLLIEDVNCMQLSKIT